MMQRLLVYHRVSLILLISLLGGVVVYWLSKPRIFVSHIYAISETDAALLLRRNTEESGEVLWRTTLGTADQTNPSPHLYVSSHRQGDLLLEPTYNEELVALSLQTGAIQWRTQLN